MISKLRVRQSGKRWLSTRTQLQNSRAGETNSRRGQPTDHSDPPEP